MADKDSFQERLKRLESKSAAPAVPPTGPATGAAIPKRRKSDGPNLMKALLIVGLVFVGGMAYLVYFTIQQTTALPRYANSQVSAQLNDVPVQPKQSSVFDRLFGGFGGTSDSMHPIAYLPDADFGWIRVTTQDAKSPDVMAEIANQWPSSAPSLEDHLGYKHLEHFIKIYRRADVEEDVMSRKKTRAMYLHPNGDFVSVGLQFLGEKSALGPVENPESWISSLANRQDKRRDSTEILELVSVAGMDSTNITKPAGSSLIARPIGTDTDVPNGVKIAVPVAHRAIMSFQGIVRPSAVEELVQSAELSALQVQLQ